MSRQDTIKAAMERNHDAVALRPSIAQGQEEMTIITNSDGVCIARDGENSLQVDLDKAYGGDSTMPGPGFLARAALGSCLSLGYLCWASSLDVPINDIKVTILSEYDGTAAVGLESDATCGYTKVHVVVDIDSPASQEDIERVIKISDERSFMHAIFTETHPITRELRLKHSAAA